MIPSIPHDLQVGREALTGMRAFGPQKHEHRSDFARIARFPLGERRSLRAFADLARVDFVLSRTKAHAA